MAVAKAEAFEIADVDFIPEKKDHVGHQLQERNRARLTDIHQKKFNKESLAVEEETTGFFTQNFKKECDAILTLLECSGVDANDRLALSEHFDSVSVRWQRLQKFFNDSVALLPAFESRKARAQLESLQQRIAQRRNALMPKKKFAFKSKLKKTENVQTNGNASRPSAAQKFAQKAAKYQQGCEVSGQSDVTITLRNDQVERKDVSLSDLVNCKVYLLGFPSTVHVSNVEKCTIVVGPVGSSVFVDRCTASEIVAGCQQLRVHHTTNTDFYLHVTSRAIIEDTSKVRFAPYNYTYPDLQEHFELSGLNQKTNNWDQVDDFNWLAMDTQSPNWQVLEVENRKSQW